MSLLVLECVGPGRGASGHGGVVVQTVPKQKIFLLNIDHRLKLNYSRMYSVYLLKKDTVCLRSLSPIYVVTYFLKKVKTYTDCNSFRIGEPYEHGLDEGPVQNIEGI